MSSGLDGLRLSLDLKGWRSQSRAFQFETLSSLKAFLRKPQPELYVGSGRIFRVELGFGPGSGLRLS